MEWKLLPYVLDHLTTMGDGARMKIALQAFGVEQRAIADAVGIDYGRLRKVLNGHVKDNGELAQIETYFLEALRSS